MYKEDMNHMLLHWSYSSQALLLIYFQYLRISNIFELVFEFFRIILDKQQYNFGLVGFQHANKCLKVCHSHQRNFSLTLYTTSCSDLICSAVTGLKKWEYMNTGSVLSKFFFVFFQWTANDTTNFHPNPFI